ncbi:glycosyl hydrolase [Paenibacillus urinalis]|uniref:glycosyl hydrolase n=1 Tax=Paenibacillus urinalis TaxID=521520 RepID=UPI001960DD11
MNRKSHFNLLRFSLVNFLSLCLLLSLVMPVGATANASQPPAITVDGVTVTAKVDKLRGNQNRLWITITEDSGITTKDFMINNNAADIYPVSTEVGDYEVYVDTKGNTQKRSGYIVSYTKRWTDADQLAKVMGEISYTSIIGQNTSQDQITTNLNLMTNLDGCTLAWESSNPDVVTSDGTVTSPLVDTTVTLTVTGSYGAASTTKEFTLTILNLDWEKRYEAENAELQGVNIDTSLNNQVGGFSGSGYVGIFNSSSEFATFTVTVPESGIYDLFIGCVSSGNTPTNVAVNDVPRGQIIVPGRTTPTPEFTEVKMAMVPLNAGTNEIRIYGEWGVTLLDYIRIGNPEVDLHALAMNVDRELSNPNANAETKRVWEFLLGNYGKNVIAGHNIGNGQQQFDEATGYFENTIGAMPAFLAFEMYDYDYAAVSNNAVRSTTTERAIAWAKESGGIVGYHWHWHMGQQYLAPGKEWWASFYKDEMSSEFGSLFTDAMTNKSGELYDYIIRDIDLISEELKKLQDAGVPVLWRPVHEASGTWFWWGGYGAENFKTLWDIMYDRMTNYHQLNNLIWVFNSDVDSDWWPGAEYVDMVSADVGADPNDHKSYSDIFYQFTERLDELGTMKMLALTETGPIPDIDKMAEDRSLWSFWATWVGIPSSTTVEKMRDTLNDPRVRSLSSLPPLYTQPPANNETILWEGYKGADAWSWNELLMAKWGGELGTYDPSVIKPGSKIEVTFRSDSDPILVIGGSPQDMEFHPSQISDGSTDQFRVATFSCDDILSQFPDVINDTSVLLVRAGSSIEITKISVTE